MENLDPDDLEDIPPRRPRTHQETKILHCLKRSKRPPEITFAGDDLTGATVDFGNDCVFLFSAIEQVALANPDVLLTLHQRGFDLDWLEFPDYRRFRSDVTEDTERLTAIFNHRLSEATSRARVILSEVLFGIHQDEGARDDELDCRNIARILGACSRNLRSRGIDRPILLDVNQQSESRQTQRNLRDEFFSEALTSGVSDMAFIRKTIEVAINHLAEGESLIPGFSIVERGPGKVALQWQAPQAPLA